MKGGFNKMIRNIVAGASDTEFEKVIINQFKNSYSDQRKQRSIQTQKNQKRSTSFVSKPLIIGIDLLECLNGEHKDQVSPLSSLKFIFERLISNLDNWAINTKIMIIFHRGMQNIKVNRKIYKDLKTKEHLLHPYASRSKDQSNYSTKMYTEISKQYSDYVKFYINIANKTDILSKPMQKISEDVRALSTSDILRHYEYFEALVTQIFQLFTHANFCRQTRLFSNLIFMLFKDLIKVYKVYYVHITEILERFSGLDVEDMKKAFIMYQNFVNLTDGIKTRANKLIYTFNFPIQLPDFYNPEKGLVDTLRVVMETNDTAKVGEFAKKLRGGMNRDQFEQKQEKDKSHNANADDGDKEYYFDCTILDKLQSISGASQAENPIQAPAGLDLMDFISKSDFSTVGGGNKAANYSNNEFDFQSFNNQASSIKAQTADEFFGASNNVPTTKPVQNQGMMDLFDVFSQPSTQVQASKPQTVDIFAGSNQPLAPSGFVPQGDPNMVLGSFYTQQAQPSNQFSMQGVTSQQQTSVQSGFQPMINPYGTQQQFSGIQQQQMIGNNPYAFSQGNQQVTNTGGQAQNFNFN